MARAETIIDARQEDRDHFYAAVCLLNAFVESDHPNDLDIFDLVAGAAAYANASDDDSEDEGCADTGEVSNMRAWILGASKGEHSIHHSM